jgi:4-amino-4-deoxy-L-arabinose transferase-like glycosyltransferase
LLLIVAAKAALLFAVVPAFSTQLKPLYQMRFVDDYDKLAANLEAGRGYRLLPEGEPTLMREPGYPWLLALVFRLFGQSLAAARLVNLLLGLATALVVLGLSSELGFSGRVARWAAVLFMLHPGTFVAESRGGFETLFTLLLALFVLLLARALRSESLGAYAIAGLVLGAAALVRSTVFLLPLGVLGWLLIRRPRGELGGSLLKAAVLGACMFVVLSPWIIRNALLTGEATLSASVRGTAAHAGQYWCLHRGDPRGLSFVDGEASDERARLAAEWGYRFRHLPSDFYVYFYTTRDELAFDRQLMQTVAARWREAPSRVVSCAASNLVAFWFAGRTWLSTALNVVMQLPFLILALGGACILASRSRAEALLPLALVGGYLWLLHSLVAAQARYSVPLVPFLALLSSVALVEGGGFLRSRGRLRRAQG